MTDSNREEGTEAHLRIYSNRSEFVSSDNNREIYREGSITRESQERSKSIRSRLNAGFFSEEIEACKSPDVNLGDLSEEHCQILKRIVASITSERGRGIVGLIIMQMCIKSICLEQCIRLHKGSTSRNSFSWIDGISMRSIDRDYITPMLRQHNLLRINRDGVMMTRTLAENYPYTKLFKAELRGAKQEWLEIVDLLESRSLNPLHALRYMLVLLHKRSEGFRVLVDKTIEALDELLATNPSCNAVFGLIIGYVSSSQYSSRLLEIAMHSLFQVLNERHIIDGELKELSQMRSANKKHGDIGDIQIVSRKGGLQILESWDAKYGKPYLRDELEELSEKLEDHPETVLAGFVVDKNPKITEDIADRINDIQDIHGTDIKILSFTEWVTSMVARCEGGDKNEIAREWLLAFVESLCQKRRGIAPIDEPSDRWLVDLLSAIGSGL